MTDGLVEVIGVRLGCPVGSQKADSVRVPKALSASSSLNSILNCAMAEASVQDIRLLAGPGIRAEPDVATIGSLCKVLHVSPKLGLVVIEEKRQED